jgi:hypothetical protein
MQSVTTKTLDNLSFSIRHKYMILDRNASLGNEESLWCIEKKTRTPRFRNEFLCFCLKTEHGIELISKQVL